MFFKKSLLLIPLTVVVVGCNNAEPPEDSNLAENRENTFYSFDTNTNANSFRDINSPRPNLGDDQDKIRTAVEDATGLDPQWVSIVGNKAYVHVNIPNNYSDMQKRKLETKIMDAITDSVPRYNIRLSLDQ
jgi:hypothetical protein